MTRKTRKVLIYRDEEYPNYEIDEFGFIYREDGDAPYSRRSVNRQDIRSSILLNGKITNVSIIQALCESFGKKPDPSIINPRPRRIDESKELHINNIEYVEYFQHRNAKVNFVSIEECAELISDEKHDILKMCLTMTSINIANSSTRINTNDFKKDLSIRISTCITLGLLEPEHVDYHRNLFTK